MTNLDATTLERREAPRYRQAARIVASTVAPILARLVRALRARRDAEHLMGLSDHLLKDVGIARCEVDSITRSGWR